MSEANAEDGLLWSWTIKNVKMSEAQYRNRICIFLSAPNFAKRKRMEQAEDSSPDPSSSACEIQISRGFSQSFPPKKILQNPGRLVPPPARILGGQNTKEKCPFIFQEKSHPRQIKKARDIFLWCCREKRGSGGTIHSRSKKVRANDIMTPPFRICRRSYENQKGFCKRNWQDWPISPTTRLLKWNLVKIKTRH